MKTTTVLAFIISLLVQVGFPLWATLYYRRITGKSWQLFAYGALVYCAFQLFTWLPISVYLDTTIGARLEGEGWAFVWLLAIALITSLVEESGRWLGYRHLFPRGGFSLNSRNGIMYGLGHACVETVLLIAGLTFGYFVAYLLLGRFEVALLAGTAEGGAGQELQDAVRMIRDTTWSQPLIVALERVLALPHQLAWTLLVMQTEIWHQKRWFGFAVLYHSSVAVIVPGLARLSGFLLAEGVNLILAIFSAWIVIRVSAISAAGGHVLEDLGSSP